MDSFQWGTLTHAAQGAYSPCQTCHRYFQHWVRSGVMQRMLHGLSTHYGKPNRRPLVYFIDGSFAPAKKGETGSDAP